MILIIFPTSLSCDQTSGYLLSYTVQLVNLQLRITVQFLNSVFPFFLLNNRFISTLASFVFNLSKLLFCFLNEQNLRDNSCLFIGDWNIFSCNFLNFRGEVDIYSWLLGIQICPFCLWEQLRLSGFHSRVIKFWHCHQLIYCHRCNVNIIYYQIKYKILGTGDFYF